MSVHSASGPVRLGASLNILSDKSCSTQHEKFFVFFVPDISKGQQAAKRNQQVGLGLKISSLMATENGKIPATINLQCIGLSN